MNFWTFCDRNAFGLFIIAIVALTSVATCNTSKDGCTYHMMSSKS